MQFHPSIARFAAFAALVVAPVLSGCASDSSGAHVFARRDNGTNIVSRLVPDGTDVATAGMLSSFTTLTPMYSDTPTFSEWVVSGGPSAAYWMRLDGDGWNIYTTNEAYPEGLKLTNTGKGDALSTSLSWTESEAFTSFTASRTRTDVLGYTLGSQTDRPLASEAEAEALRQGKQNTLTFDNAPTSGSNNPVKSGGIWSAIWGTASTAFSSLYDWAVAQLGLKRDYTDLSYDTTETVEVPALHATMTSQQSGQVIVEYDLLCTEEVPDPPQIGHSYTWKADGAAFYVIQGVSALRTTWVLYSYTDEALGGVTTQNATQGFYPDVEFRPSNAVITIHKTTAQKQVTTEDTIALESKTVPTSRTVNGKALTGNVTLTGADIAVSGADPTKIDAALAGKASKSDATLAERGFSEWTITATNPAFPGPYSLSWNANQSSWEFYSGSTLFGAVYNSSATAVSATLTQAESTYVATRTVLQGYVLGAQTDKPLASEAEAEALRTGKLDKSGGTFGTTTISLTDDGIAVSDTQSSNATSLSSSHNFLVHRDGLGVRYFVAPSTSGILALTAPHPTAGNLAALDASGNPTDSGILKSSVVTTPVYDGTEARHVFMDAAGTNAVDAAIAGFRDKDVAHRWTAQRRCVVYVRVVGSGSGKSVVYAHVNNQDAPTDDTSHLLFKHAFTGGAGTVVPVYLSEGDSLDLRVTDNNLSQLQYSVFYTD